MPTAAQTQRQVAIAKARHGFADAEAALLAALAATPIPSDIQATLARRDAALAAIDAARADLFVPGADPLAVSALDPALPAALLPLRLETRRSGTVLLVRIFPDDSHVYAHAEGVTAQEARALRVFWKTLEPLRDIPPIVEAWLRLCESVGVRRAAYLAGLDPGARPGVRPAGLAVPARAALLPDRFVAHAWIDGAAVPTRVEAWALVRDPLSVSPDPTAVGASGDGTVDQGALWMTHFAEAEAAGMAIRVPLPRAQASIDRLVVLGVRASEDPASSAASLTRLLVGHQHVHGLTLPPPLTATNHLPGERTAYASRPDPVEIYPRALDFRIISGAPFPVRGPGAINDGVYDTTTRRWTRHWRPMSPAFQLAQALGVSPETFTFAAGADDAVLARETVMTAVLLQAFGGRMRESLAPGANPAQVDIVLEMLGYASALGPFPSLNVGRQPYGVLPVALGDEPGLPADYLSVWRLIEQFRQIAQDAATAHAPRVTGAEPADPTERLFALLQTEGLPFTATLRALLRGDLATRAMAGSSPANLQLLGSRRAAFRAALQQWGAPPSAVFPVTDFLFQSEAALIDALSATAGRPLDGPRRVAQRMGERWSLMSILDQSYLDDLGLPEPAPTSIFYEILRQTVLDAADVDTRDLLLNYAGTDPNFRPTDPAQLDPGGPLHGLRARLTHAAPIDMVAPGQVANLGDLFSVRGPGFGTAAMRAFASISDLAALTDDQIMLLFSASLGLLTHRLDAFYTSRARQRLVQLRSNPPPGMDAPDGFFPGLNIGAYGYLEAIAPPSPASAGHVLAPSVAHGVTAGVLLSADYARRLETPARGDAYAVELSSRRVRAAEEILDAMRHGQPLPALLGYRLERGLVEAGGDAPALIARLRAIASLAPPTLDAQVQPGPSADAVADGLAILNRATGNLMTDVDLAGLAPGAGTLTAHQSSALTAVLKQLQDNLDAVADCLLAESVHQFASGNPERAAAAGDALSGSGAIPDRLDVLHPPERGIGVTHRLLVDIPAGASAAAGWDRASPRAAADSDLDAWLSFLLPAPPSIQVTAILAEGDPTILTLNDLLPALDAEGPGLSALDLAFEAADASALPNSGLAARLRPAAAGLLAANGLTGDFALDWSRGADWSRTAWSLGEAVAIAKKARALWSSGRGLRADDLPISPGAEDLTDRVATARASLVTARTAATAAAAGGASAAVVQRAVAWSHALGYAGLTEGSASEAFKAAAAEFGTRLDNVAGVGDGEGLARLVGGGLPILTRFTRVPAEFTDLFAADIGAAAADLRAFVSRAARVRAPVASMEMLLTYADATGQGGARHVLSVGQWPPVARPWVGLPGDHARGQTSFVCWRREAGAGFTATPTPTTIAGLYVDAWSETIPQADADASVVFHANSPSTAAPNAILLCVPANGIEAWSEGILLDHVLEAVSLAKVRAAGPEVLQALDWLLPLLMLDDAQHQPSLALRVLDEALA